MRTLLFLAYVASVAAAKDFYSEHFKVNAWDGEEIDLAKYKGKVTVIANVASECGYTDSTYSMLKRLHDTYHNDGLEVLAFPCNQFGGQEPGTAEDVFHFVQSGYGTDLHVFDKVLVKGEGAHPVFKWLEKETESVIAWNFECFVIDRKGHLIDHVRSGGHLDEVIIEDALHDVPMHEEL
eukprot:TRINITY_DN12430_c0_g2_i4.p1 TRINITY_DN12430_c0_g2~~TRINITY_DN12430_c0_g2_i4.p1  ORF type:complete len:180 (+),score=42.97 TRINITY_DN12430_c0_g2_i4:187-726(+)